MPNLSVLPDALDYPVSLPSSGPGTSYPFAAENITTEDGSNILDANIQMLYRTRQYELTPQIVLSGSAHKDTDLGGGDSVHEEWTWEFTPTYSPVLDALLQDDTTPTTEEDFITFADRQTNGRKGWIYKALLEDPPPLIGEIYWTYQETTTIGGVPTVVDADSTEGVRLDSFRVEFATGDTGSLSAPVIVGDDFQGAFFSLFNISIGVPTGFASAWLNAPAGITGGRPTAYTTAGEISMAMTRKTLDMPIEWTSTIEPNTDVVFDSDTQTVSFTATPTLDFAWT